MSRKDCIRLVFSIVIVLAAAAWVSAATDSNKPSEVVMTNAELRLQKTISVDFRETPIDDVIRTIAEQANIDVIKSPKVTGNVTAKLTNVPLREALDNILAAQGWGYAISENVIRIAPASELALEKKEEPMISRVYTVTYADVKEVEAALNKFKSEKGTIASNAGTSNIIVTDYESKVTAIDQFVKEIDRMTPQVVVEARIYDITSRDILDLGITWQGGRNTDFSGTTTNPGSATSVGVNPTGDVKPFSTGTFTSGNIKTTGVTGALRLGFLSNDVDIDTLLRAQKQKIDAKLLANPRILVLDNQTAEIKIIQQIPYQQLVQGGGSTVPFGTIEFKEVGVTLNVVPHVTRDGIIRLKLAPSFSIKAEDKNLFLQTSGTTALQFPIPVINKRDAVTTLLVKDGQTVVLGGLRRKDIAKQIDKVPLLADIPVLGQLFKFTSTDETVSEMVVFVTPKIVETSVMSESETDKYNATNFATPKPEADDPPKSDK